MMDRMAAKTLWSWLGVVWVTLALASIMVFNESIPLWWATGILGPLALVWGWFCLEHRPVLLHFSVRMAGFAALEASVLLVVTYLGFAVMSAVRPEMVQWVGKLYLQLNAPPGFPAALPMLLVMAVAEEFIWRGVFFNLLRRQLKGLPLVLACSLAFCTAHFLSGQIGFAAMVLVLGIVWTAQRMVHNNLWVPILTHLIWNLAVMVYFPLVPVPT